ncbi:MAG: hypothetical protein HKO02_14800 [Hyphomonadaceae bacterium]|nr:hypothetical protein [Hyphomonadaceae bacterium]
MSNEHSKPKIRNRNRSGSSHVQQSESYSVGYKKPPKSRQFKPGQSGNPKGRRKGSKNTATLLTETLDQKITIREDGKTKKVPKRKAALMQQVKKAVEGDPRAFKQVFEMDAKHTQIDTDKKTKAANNPIKTTEELLAEDREILEAVLGRTNAIIRKAKEADDE